MIDFRVKICHSQLEMGWTAVWRELKIQSLQRVFHFESWWCRHVLEHLALKMLQLFYILCSDQETLIFKAIWTNDGLVFGSSFNIKLSVVPILTCIYYIIMNQIKVASYEYLLLYLFIKEVEDGMLVIISIILYKKDFLLTLTAEGDHDVSCTTLYFSECERSDFSPHLQSFLNGIIHLVHTHVRCVVHYPVKTGEM